MCWLPLFLALLQLDGCPAAERLDLFPEKRIVSPGQELVPFALPAVAEGEQVRLGLKARLDWPGGFGGHNPFLGVGINGQTVQPGQLVNKPPEFTMNDGSDASWWGQGAWRLLYSGGFDQLFTDDPPAYMVADADPYLFVWDITPYVKPGGNAITLWHPKLLAQDTTVVVADCYVEVGAPITPPQIGGAAIAADPLPTYVAQDMRPVALSVRVGQCGRLEVQVGDRTLRLSTRTSEPEGRWRADVGTALQAVEGGRSTSSWTGSGYTVQRTVEILPDHVHVADTVSNTSDRLLGVMIEHRLELVGEAPLERLLCGRRVYKEHQSTPSPGNPTALARWPELVVGLVAEDDILRVHNVSFSEPEAVGIGDRTLGMAPGSSHTLEWSIYPVPQGDYWDFINAIRRNWGSNFTIPGPSVVEPTPDGRRTSEEYGRWAKTRKLAIAIAGQQAFKDGYLAEGTAIPQATEWNDGFRLWKQKLQQLSPNTRALCYLHSQICTEADCQAKYADCRVLGPGGEQEVSPYSYPCYLFLPRPDNAYGQALTKTVEFILDDLGADGIYNDCFTHDTAPYAWGLPWDGCTVPVDPTTHATGKPYSSVVLLQQRWKEELVRLCRSRGKIVIGNGPLFTRTMLRLQVPTFTETASFGFLVDTHLSAPWGLATHPAEANDRGRAYLARAMLERGGVYSAYVWDDDPQQPPFVGDFFPITPTELRAGVVIAEERILTSRSGRLGWPDGSRAEVHVYDAEGKRVEGPEAREVEDNGRRLTELRLAPGQFAALLRLP